MTTAPRAALAAALGSACLWGGTASPAQAGLTPLSGLITVTVSPTATLAVSGLSATGSLGPTDVIDARSGSTGYTVSVSTPGFDLVGPTPSASATTHIPDSAATVQLTASSGGTAVPVTPVALPSLLPVFRMTYAGAVVLVPAVSSYTLGLSLTIPAAAGRGLYTGTVTQTVV